MFVFENKWISHLVRMVVYSVSETVAISRVFPNSCSPRRRKPRRGPQWCCLRFWTQVGGCGGGRCAGRRRRRAVAAWTIVIAIFSCAACRSASSSIWRSPSRTKFWRWPGHVAAARPDYRRHLHRRRPMTDRSRHKRRSSTWWDRYCSRRPPSTGSGNRPAPWS